jgi:hypothetical protein
MKVNLTTWQRTMLSQIVGEMGGNIRAVVEGSSLFLKLGLTDEEKQKVGWHINEAGNAAWNPNMGDLRWEMEFTPEEYRFLKQAILGYQSWLVGNHEQVVDLFRELQIEIT